MYGLTTVIIASELDSSLQRAIKFKLHMYMFSSMGILAVEMQDISPYRDTLGSDTVSIHI